MRASESSSPTMAVLQDRVCCTVIIVLLLLTANLANSYTYIISSNKHMGLVFSKLFQRIRRNSKSHDAATTMATKHTVFGVERDIPIPCKTFPKLCFPTEDEIQRMEETMPGCQHGWFPSCTDNVQLHYRKWLPPADVKIKAILVWNHGISHYSGFGYIAKNGRKLGMSLLSSELMKHGIALYSYDMYGHGYSEGVRSLIPGTYESNKQDYINFCNTIVVPENPDATIPIILSGISYGACLTIHVAKYFQENTSEPASARMDSMIVLAPAIIGDLPPAPVVYTLRYLLAPMFPNWIPFFMPNPISPDRIWRDQEVLQHHDLKGRFMNMGIDMSGRPFRLRTAVNLLSALEDVRTKAIPGLTVPFLCQHGTKDMGVPIAGADLLYEKSSTPAKDKVFHRLEGAYHDLLTEPNAEDIVDNMIQFISTRLTK